MSTPTTPQPAPGNEFPVTVTAYAETGEDYYRDETTIDLPNGLRLSSAWAANKANDDYHVLIRVDGDRIIVEGEDLSGVLGDAVPSCTRWAIAHGCAADLATRGLHGIIHAAVKGARDRYLAAWTKVDVSAVLDYCGSVATGRNLPPGRMVALLASAQAILDAYGAASGRHTLGDLALLGDLHAAHADGTLLPKYTDGRAAMVHLIETGAGSKPGQIIRGDDGMGDFFQGEQDAVAGELAALGVAVDPDADDDEDGEDD